MPGKKEWLCPKLIVLVKGSPEEHCLKSCKQTGGGSGPVSTFQQCVEQHASGMCGSACVQITVS